MATVIILWWQLPSWQYGNCHQTMMATSTYRWQLLLFLFFMHFNLMIVGTYIILFFFAKYHDRNWYFFLLKLLYISSCTSTVLICPPWISLGQEARRLRTSLMFLHGLSTLSRLCLPQTGQLIPNMENCRLVLVSLSTRHAYKFLRHNIWKNRHVVTVCG